MNVTELNESGFENAVLRETGCALVDFYADWCAPCKSFAPTVERFANESGDRVKVYKVNTDDCPALTETYKIRSIPTVCVFKGGEMVARATGVKSLRELRELAGK